MLLFEYSRRQRFHAIVVAHVYCSLHYDRTMIQLFIDQVHRAASDLDPLLERLPLGVQAGKRGQERRMNVQDAVLKLADKSRAHQPHVPGKADDRYRALF